MGIGLILKSAFSKSASAAQSSDGGHYDPIAKHLVDPANIQKFLSLHAHSEEKEITTIDRKRYKKEASRMIRDLSEMELLVLSKLKPGIWESKSSSYQKLLSLESSLSPLQKIIIDFHSNKEDAITAKKLEQLSFPERWGLFIHISQSRLNNENSSNQNIIVKIDTLRDEYQFNSYRKLLHFKKHYPDLPVPELKLILDSVPLRLTSYSDQQETSQRHTVVTDHNLKMTHDRIRSTLMTHKALPTDTSTPIDYAVYYMHHPVLSNNPFLVRDAVQKLNDAERWFLIHYFLFYFHSKSDPTPEEVQLKEELKIQVRLINEEESTPSEKLEKIKTFLNQKLRGKEFPREMISKGFEYALNLDTYQNVAFDTISEL